MTEPMACSQDSRATVNIRFSPLCRPVAWTLAALARAGVIRKQTAVRNLGRAMKRLGRWRIDNGPWRRFGHALTLPVPPPPAPRKK